MIQRRDFIWSLLIAAGVTLAFVVISDIQPVQAMREDLRQALGPGNAVWIPVGAFVWAAVRIGLFYVLFSLALGTILHIVARVLASERGDDGRWRVPRRRYYVVFVHSVLIVTVYLHIHAILLYPALFESSWRWAVLAGSWTFVWAFGLAGKIGVVLVCLVMLRKRSDAILPWIARRRTVLVAAAALLSATVAVCWWPKQAADRNRGPNVIILGLDAIRPDHVSALGWRRQTTPNLDGFLHDSVVFTNAFGPLARTGPAWMSILTGCYPTQHNHRCDLMPKAIHIPPMATVAGHLQKLGYSTSYFIDNSNFLAMDREMGFAHIEQPDPNVVYFGLSFFPLNLVLYNYILNNRLGFHEAPELRANQAFSAVYDARHFARAVESHLVRMKGEEKFFLAAHTCIAHAPFCVRYPYTICFPPEPPTPRNRFSFRWPFERVLWEKEFERRLTGQEWPLLFSQEYNLYDALVKETDDWLGMVLASIRRLGLYDNSLIVVVSDHGEDLWRNDLAYPYLTSNHGFHVWGDDSYRVVLAVKLPKARKVGARVPHLARLIDVAPTVLEALGLPPLPEAEGVSLMPQIKDPAVNPHLSAYAEAGLSLANWFVPGHRSYPFDHWVQFQYVEPGTHRIYRKMEYMRGFVMAKDRSLRDEQWKIIAWPLEGEPLPYRTALYDVQQDPTNVNDLATSQPEMLAQMRRRLAPFIESDANKYGFAWQWDDRASSPTQAAK